MTFEFQMGFSFWMAPMAKSYSPLDVVFTGRVFRYYPSKVDEVFYLVKHFPINLDVYVDTLFVPEQGTGIL